MYIIKLRTKKKRFTNGEKRIGKRKVGGKREKRSLKRGNAQQRRKGYIISNIIVVSVKRSFYKKKSC